MGDVEIDHPVAPHISVGADLHRLQHDGARLLGFADDFVEAVMGDHGERIDGLLAGALAVGQAQPAPERLFGQDVGRRGAQRHDGIEVGDVPAFLQLVHMDDDFGLAVVFERDQFRHGVIALLAPQRGIDPYHAVLVAAAEEALRLDRLADRLRMRRVLGDNEHERMHHRLAGALRIVAQLELDVLVGVNPVLEFDALQFGFRHRSRVEVLPGRDRRLLDEAVRHRGGEVVAVDHIAEIGGFRPHGLRRGREFEAEHWPQVRQRLEAGLGAVAVRFVHQQHEVGQAGEIVEVALADIFVQFLDAPGVLVDLVHVEDVDHHVGVDQFALPAQSAPLIPVVAGDDHGRRLGKFRDALEHVFRLSGREILDQLVVDRGVRRQHEEIP